MCIRDSVGGRIQRIDERLVDERVELEPYAGGATGTMVLDLALDAVEQSGPQAARRHEKLAVGAALRVAGEVVEQVRQVGGDLLVAGQQPEVLIMPRGFRAVSYTHLRAHET